MQINLEIRFTSDTKDGDKKVYCFKHAVQAANRGEDVQLEIDEFGSPGDMRSTHCKACFTEEEIQA